MAMLEDLWSEGMSILYAIAGLVLLGTGIQHVMNPAQSLLVEGVPLILFTLPSAPSWLAQIVGVLVALMGLGVSATGFRMVGNDQSLLG